MSRVRFYRSDDGAIAGVCTGLAESFDLNTNVVRFLFVLFTLVGGGGIFTYIALAFSMPRKDKVANSLDPKVLGVCSALSQRFSLEVGIMRFLAIASAFFSMGLTLVAYIALYFLMPEVSKDIRDIN